MSKRESRLLNLLVLSAASFILTLSTPTIPAVSDFASYVQMSYLLEPMNPAFGKRILIPFIVYFFGGGEIAFHYVNVAFLTLAMFLVSEKYGQTSALLFLCLTPAVFNYAGEPGIDAGIWFFFALALWASDNIDDFYFTVIIALSAATHPIAFVLTTIVLVTQKEPRKWIYALPGLIVFLLLSGSPFVLFVPTLERFLWGARSLNVMLLGLFMIRRDREGLMTILVFIACIGFSLLASGVERMVAPVGILLTANLVQKESIGHNNTES